MSNNANNTRSIMSRTNAVVSAGAVGFALGVIIAVTSMVGFWDRVFGAQTGDITMRGTVTPNCNITVTTASGATSLPVSVDGAQTPTLGTVTQSCNKRVGYTLTVASDNCTAGEGARLNETVSGEYLAYTVSFDNPATGGSSDLSGLLAPANCANQTGRNVTNYKVSTPEDSTITGSFTGNSTLEPGTYQDRLVITMAVK